jgi:enamine deaminase RidA (YjgF/YER057c/UK114 family)
MSTASLGEDSYSLLEHVRSTRTDAWWPPGTSKRQALQTVENLLAVLAEHQVGPDALVKTTVFLAGRERADLVRVWDTISPRLGRAPSTLIGVSMLGYPDQLVEIEAIAVLDRSA